MTEPDSKHILLVEQIATLTEEAQDLLRILSAEHGIDAYSARQRLLGSELAMLGSGPREKVEKIATLLGDYGLKSWIIRPTTPHAAPQRLTGLEVRDEAIVFTTPQDEIRCPVDMRVVGVLADISGNLLDKNLKRLMAKNVYQGQVDNSRLDDAEIRKTILLGQPVLDLYLIDEEGRVTATLRALPGKFDHRGLGERATSSSKQNFGALVAMLEESLDNLTLNSSFSLCQIPGLQLKRAGDTSNPVQENMKNLTRYGWLMTDLALQPQPHHAAVDVAEGPSVGEVAAAVMIGRPELAATGMARHVPGMGEVIEEIDAAVTDEGKPPEEVKPADTSLPLPPGPRERIINVRMILYNGAAAVIFLLLFGAGKLGWIPVNFLVWGYKTGIIQFVASALLFWGGFNFFLLKRRIENTPTSKVRSLAMGMVEVHGRARRKFALVAPMSQAACVWYRLRKYRSDDRGNWRKTSDTDSGHVPFYIEDATGRVTIDPYRASIRAGQKQEGVPGQGSLLFGGGRSSDSNEKWVEDVIHEGTSLYILGEAKLQKQERKSLRERKIEKLRDLKLDRAALHKYDTDGDGRISEDEWQSAREDIEEQVLQERLAEETVAARQQDYIVIGHSNHRSHPFVIAATHSETHLTRKYVLLSVPMLVGSLLTGIWGLAYALRHLGVF